MTSWRIAQFSKIGGRYQYSVNNTHQAKDCSIRIDDLPEVDVAEWGCHIFAHFQPNDPVEVKYSQLNLYGIPINNFIAMPFTYPSHQIPVQVFSSAQGYLSYSPTRLTLTKHLSPSLSTFIASACSFCQVSRPHQHPIIFYSSSAKL